MASPTSDPGADPTATVRVAAELLIRRDGRAAAGRAWARARQPGGAAGLWRAIAVETDRLMVAQPHWIDAAG